MAIMPLILYIVMAMMTLPALIIVCLMYGTGVVLARNQKYVRHIAVCVCLHWAVLSVIDAVWGRKLSSPHHVLHKYTAMAMAALL